VHPDIAGTTGHARGAIIPLTARRPSVGLSAAAGTSDMNRRRRPRTLHRHCGFHDGAKIIVDIAETRALLESGQVRDDVSRLMVELVIRTGPQDHHLR
jgi:hypothetical protein